jgi:DNA-directed RNA polymerase omega subunit
MTNLQLRDLVAKTESKYSLVVAVAKRARQIVDTKGQNTEHKPVTEALMELKSGKVKVVRKRRSNKEEITEEDAP